MEKEKSNVQLIWGIALVLAGIGVFYRIPQVWPDIEKIEHFRPILPFIRFCFYLIGIMLIGGGAKKLHARFFKSHESESESETDQ